MGGKLTQDPATPSLVERLHQPLTMSMFLNISDLAKEALRQREEAGAALEAQQARIAELEAERDQYLTAYRHWAMIADQRLGASNRQLKRARNLQALADRYEKAMKPFERAFQSLDTRFDDETKIMITLPTTKRVRPTTYVYVEDVLRLLQAFSSQGRREGGEG